MKLLLNVYRLPLNHSTTDIVWNQFSKTSLRPKKDSANRKTDSNEGMR